MEPSIKVENLSKQYRIGTARERQDTLRDAIVHGAGRLLTGRPQRAAKDDTFWALKDVSFEVEPGEVLGVIGRNGAGKSTLLKILSRITEPTRGRAILNGRVGSLLEVGTGFHPELTGRENVYLNGAILGMQRKEIERKFDEIVAFSEIEKFIDTPVKRYSSGMYVRLAFAVAAHLEPEILLVDEVLAVGDAAFQKKCIGKMGGIAQEGRTVIFVSHNMVATQSLCQRALWIDRGNINCEGGTNQVVRNYLQSTYDDLASQEWHDLDEAPGNDLVRLREISIRPSANAETHASSPGSEITMQTPLTIRVKFQNLIPNNVLHTTLHLYDEHGAIAFSTLPPRQVVSKLGPLPKATLEYNCQIPGNLLNAGTYRVVLLIVKEFSRVVFRYDDALMFDVRDIGERGAGWLGKEPGSLHPLLDWEIHIVNDQ